MATAKGLRPGSRRESDLLLEVVLAHLAYDSAKTDQDRQAARERFVARVRTLYDFITGEEAVNNSVSG